MGRDSYPKYLYPTIANGIDAHGIRYKPTTKNIPSKNKQIWSNLNYKKKGLKLRVNLRETIQLPENGKPSQEKKTFLTKHGRKVGLTIVCKTSCKRTQRGNRKELPWEEWTEGQEIILWNQPETYSFLKRGKELLTNPSKSSREAEATLLTTQQKLTWVRPEE